MHLRTKKKNICAYKLSKNNKPRVEIRERHGANGGHVPAKKQNNTAPDGGWRFGRRASTARTAFGGF